ncbi:MAG: hypothetical protein H7Z20_00400 [Bdellovibrio sp.]|nr:hypothetical protein [Methylotenera sp.]
MIFGAGFGIALVNIMMLIGAIASMILLVLFIKHKKIKASNAVKKISTLKLFSIGFLFITAIPLWFGVGFIAVTYILDKPYNDTFERNNKNFQAMYQTIQHDDLMKFINALEICGQYCVGSPNPGARKYDILLTTAEYAKAVK